MRFPVLLVLLTDGSVVTYNKFTGDTLSPHDNSSQQSDYNCVVARGGRWQVTHCNETHQVVCQSHNLLPGNSLFTLFHLLVDGILHFDVCTLFICVFRLGSYSFNFDCQAPQLLQPNLAARSNVCTVFWVLGAVIILLLFVFCRKR